MRAPVRCIVQVASRFRCKVSLKKGVCVARVRTASWPVMLLAAAVGTTIVVETDGPDELAAMVAIVSLLSDDLERRR